MVTRLSRSIAAIGLAVIMICMFAFPTVASVAAAQPKRIINVQVIYDESFRAFALNELGENPLQRLRATLVLADRSPNRGTLSQLEPLFRRLHLPPG